MKRILALLICMMMFISTAGCDKKGMTGDTVTFTGIIEEIYDNSILVSVVEDVEFDKARVQFASDLKIPFNLIVGQQVKITILPEIRESYPVQVTAVAIELDAEPAAPDPAKADYSVSFYRADSYKDNGFDFIASKANNSGSLAISSRKHIPVISVEDKASLEEFVKGAREYFQVDTAYGDSEAFAGILDKYDDEYFEKNYLLILYTQEPSGSIRHKIKDTSIDGDTLTVIVEAIVPEMGTADMADWFMVLEFNKEEIKGCEKFDAYYESK
ncbi:hypothetical protein OXPF_36330 [Oxobacter pfennigii]|uniref:Uncharacterized protein n=1 Tax=Oxobacter pfennigii TaxID=36849 RepID=A0A0P8W4W1_9CLOT|nr:hypothetical protein [Oxobacter pfennigii]KPU42865.1 hypothetical protein OXPF_36330 [Oxobacter pfennigii]